MEFHIRPIKKKDIEDIVQLSLMAWVPVFDSFKQILGSKIFSLIWPDWQNSQKGGIEKICIDETKSTVIVAEVNDDVVGFLAYELKTESKTGEVIFLAVHPDYQNQGIGTKLINYALREMKEQGMNLAVVETGGDPAHAPARKAYQKTRYTPLPLVRYF